MEEIRREVAQESVGGLLPLGEGVGGLWGTRHTLIIHLFKKNRINENCRL